MKDFFKHNRLAAIAALIVIIVLSLVIGINRSVGKLSAKVEEAYAASDEKYGSARKDVQKFCTYFNELYAITASAGIIRPDYSVELAEKTKKPFGDAYLLAQAYTDATADYNRFINTPGIAQTATAEATRCFAELQAMQLRLKNNVPYNSTAKEYNKVLQSFPANIFDFVHSEASIYN